MSSPWIDSPESGRHSISASPKASLVPALRSEENGTTSAAGKSRSARISRIVEPTAPVAPTTPTL